MSRPMPVPVVSEPLTCSGALQVPLGPTRLDTNDRAAVVPDQVHVVFERRARVVIDPERLLVHRALSAVRRWNRTSTCIPDRPT